MSDNEGVAGPKAKDEAAAPTSRRWQLDRGRLIELVVADVLLAFLISGILLALQVWIDDRREDREVRRDDLRFARELSIVDPISKPLANADLSDRNLTALNLSDAVLLDADLRGTVLDTTNFERAALLRADLRDTLILRTNFTGARLSGVDLTGSRWAGAVVTGANFSGAILDGVEVESGCIESGGEPPRWPEAYDEPDWSTCPEGWRLRFPDIQDAPSILDPNRPRTADRAEPPNE